MAIDWSQSDDVERVSGRMNGLPVIKGTRVQPETIIANLEGGSSVEEVHENYPQISIPVIRRVIAFYEASVRALAK